MCARALDARYNEAQPKLYIAKKRLSSIFAYRPTFDHTLGCDIT
jgi:hypothetical protein